MTQPIPDRPLVGRGDSIEAAIEDAMGARRQYAQDLGGQHGLAAEQAQLGLAPQSERGPDVTE